MKKLSITLLCAVLLILTGANIAAQKTDFSGIWKIDKEKSDFGRYGPLAAIQRLHVIDKKDSIIIEVDITKKSFAYNGNVLVTGSENKFRRTKRKTSESVKRDSNSPSLIFIRKDVDDGPGTILTFNIMEEWSLSADKNELTIKYTAGQKGFKPDMMTFIYTRE